MLKVTPLDSERIVVLEPDGALCAADFKSAAATIDPLIDTTGLNGVVIYTKEFPGWDSFGALAGHLKFVRDHHRLLGRVAIVTDSRLGDFAETIASHFVSARIKQFPFGEIESAKIWASSGHAKR